MRFHPRTGSLKNHGSDLSGVQSANPISFSASNPMPETQDHMAPVSPFEAYDRKVKEDKEKEEAEIRDLIDEKYINNYYQRRSRSK